MQDTNLNKINFSILDGLRGIAAVYVVINHCRGNLLMGGEEYSQSVPISDWSFSTKAYYGLLQGTSLGTEFVFFFFVLSGFSIAHSLRKRKSTLAFYKRRLVRLYFPYVLSLVWAFSVYQICSGSGYFDLNASVFASVKNTLFNLIYIPHGELIPQFWSLSHEVIFYILAPLILLSHKTRMFSIFILGGLYLVSFIYSPFDITGGNILMRFFFDYGAFFVLGIVLYQTFDHPFWQKLGNKIFFIASSILIFSAMVVLKYKFGEDNKITPLLSGLLSIILIVNFLKYNIQNRLLKFLGEMSYTIYISHFASMYLFGYLLIEMGIIDKMASQIWYLWIIGVIWCVFLAVPFYFIAEKPTKIWLSKQRTKNVA